MRCATTLAPATLVAAGCASLQPVRLPDKELHAVDDQALRGKTTGGPDVEVRIDDIATMDIPADTLGARRVREYSLAD